MATDTIADVDAALVVSSTTITEEVETGVGDGVGEGVGTGVPPDVVFGVGAVGVTVDAIGVGGVGVGCVDKGVGEGVGTGVDVDGVVLDTIGVTVTVDAIGVGAGAGVGWQLLIQAEPLLKVPNAPHGVSVRLLFGDRHCCVRAQ
jgi:hypothetical protein